MPPIKPANSEVDSRQIINGREAYVQAALDLIGLARREIALLSFNLDGRIYNRDALVEACKNFILQSPRSRLRILLNDPAPAARGHQLVDLGRRLSSFVEFRILGERQHEVRSEWLIADEQHLLERRTPESLEAGLFQDSPQVVHARRKQFDDWWQVADVASTFRDLHLG